MTQTDITPPNINESLLFRKLIFCTNVLISGNRSIAIQYHISVTRSESNAIYIRNNYTCSKVTAKLIPNLISFITQPIAVQKLYTRAIDIDTTRSHNSSFYLETSCEYKASLY